MDATKASKTVHVFMCTTDGGSNEVACRKFVATLTRDIPNILFLENTCMEHSHHLISMGSLQLVDQLLSSFAGRSWKYYSSLAIFTNVARSVSRPLYHSWCELFDAVSGASYVKKMFPRCCSTRWGSISATEERILQAGCQRLKTALTLAFDTKRKNSTTTSNQKKQKQDVKESKENDRNLNPDILAVEAVKEYQIKMGKWRRHAVEVLADSLFEVTIRLMSKAREPLNHLSNFLKQSTASATQTDKLMGGHLGHLACGKALEISTSFNQILGA